MSHYLTDFSLTKPIDRHFIKESSIFIRTFLARFDWSVSNFVVDTISFELYVYHN